MSSPMRTAVAVCVVVCLAGTASGQIGVSRVHVIEFTEAPVIDGSGADAVWGDAAWYNACDKWQETEPPSAENASMRFKMGWYGDHLYLLAEVNDDTDDASNADNPWDRDSLEVYLDLSNVGGDIGDDQNQADAWASAGGPSQMRFRYDGAVKHFGAGSVDLTDDEAVYAVSNPEGMTYYEIEFRPPAPAKALLGYGLFGFIVQLNDADTGANEGHTIGWWGGGQLELGNYNDEPGFSERPYQTADVYADARGLNSGYAPGPIVEDSDLVFYFDFDDAGSGVTDESEYAHPATVVGDVTGAEPGIRHGCASFANGGYVDLDGPNVPAAHIPTGGFTLAAWLNVPDNDASHAIWNARYDGDPDDVWLCHPELRDGDYRITLRSSAGDTIGSITAGTPLFSEWVHYAATFDLATESLTLYVNGEVVEDLEALETVAAIADNWDLGARIGVNVDDNRPLEGLMDEFYLFRRALSAAEVTELYTLNMPEPLDPDGDEDGDGVPNGQEEDLGTDPFDSDTDNDGVSDYDEIWYDGDGDYTPGADLNPLNSDTDGDGVRDGTEVNLGSDPLDPTDVPPLPAASPAGLALLAALLTGLSIRVLKRK